MPHKECDDLFIARYHQQVRQPGSLIAIHTLYYSLTTGAVHTNLLDPLKTTCYLCPACCGALAEPVPGLLAGEVEQVGGEVEPVAGELVPVGGGVEPVSDEVQLPRWGRLSSFHRLPVTVSVVGCCQHLSQHKSPSSSHILPDRPPACVCVGGEVKPLVAETTD